MDLELQRYNLVEKHHWWWQGRRKLIEQILADKKPSRLLEIGCGTGETLTFLKKLFPKAELYGVDLSSLAVEYAKSRNHLNIFKADAIKLPFKNNYYDLILFLDVLEHIKNDQKAVNEALRVLKPKGIIVITSPAMKFIWSYHDKMLGHERRYNLNEITNLATKAGLEVYYINYFNFFLSPFIILVRLITKLKFTKRFFKKANFTYYSIVDKKYLNTLLKFIFISEIKLLKYVKLPFGVSAVAVLVKPDGDNDSHFKIAEK